MTTNLDLAKVVAAHVQIDAIALRKASVVSAVDPILLPDELTLNQSHRAAYRRDGTSPRLEVSLDFQFSAMHERPGEAPVELLRLEATFVVLYSVPEGKEYPDECLSQFAWLNGAYNAWPYWRELVQTIAGRTGLAAIVVPVYRPRVVQVPGAGEQLQLSERP